MYAVVRVRGSVNVAKAVEDTLKMLRLNQVNHCVLVPKDKNYEGMLRKVESYVTWGEISEEVLERLVSRRGRLAGDKRIDDKEAGKALDKIRKDGVKDAGIKPVFRLSPPSKGYKATRKRFPMGDLGNRGETINELLKRMI